jgi:hypothetical protein
METAKLLQFLELMEAKFDCGGNTRQRSADPKMTLYGRTMLKIKMIVTGWRAWITIQL